MKWMLFNEQFLWISNVSHKVRVMGHCMAVLCSQGDRYLQLHSQGRRGQLLLHTPICLLLLVVGA